MLFKYSVENTLKNLALLSQKLNNENLLSEITGYLHENKFIVDIEDTSWVDDVPRSKGIYYFEIEFPESKKSWNERIQGFGDNWNSWKSEVIGKSPQYFAKKGKKAAGNAGIDNWIPFYLGKRDNIKSRIKEHIIGPTNDDTTALRLKSKKSKLRGYGFRLSYVEFNLTKEEYCFIDTLEKSLRLFINPIIGRQ